MEPTKCWGRRAHVRLQPTVDEVVEEIKKEKMGIQCEVYYQTFYPKQFVQSKRLNSPLKQPK